VAYEVTKRIKGRDYRYVVDSYRDPETNRRKERWKYVGVLDKGELRVGDRKPRKRVTRDDIVAATARLLEFRNPEHITVSVIAASTGASRSAFYRHFGSPKEAITEALVRIVNEAVLELPPLGEPRSLGEARTQLRVWCKAFDYSVGLNRTCKRAMLQGYLGRLRTTLETAWTIEKPVARLSEFFKQLNDAGLVAIDEPEVLAEAVRGLHCALRMSVFALLPGEQSPVPEFDRIYPLIERAVFGQLAPNR
jgi:AcrR family transcriptional regulator